MGAAFAYNAGLTELSFPEVRHIGYGAFSNAYGPFSNIDLPKCETISTYAFYLVNAGEILALNLPECTSMYQSIWNNNLLLSELILPKCSAAQDAFYNCYSLGLTLEKLELPVMSTLTISSTKNLRYLSIPSVESIPRYTFQGNYLLKTINLEFCKNIEEGAFSNCI